MKCKLFVFDLVSSMASRVRRAQLRAFSASLPRADVCRQDVIRHVWRANVLLIVGLAFPLTNSCTRDRSIENHTFADTSFAKYETRISTIEKMPDPTQFAFVSENLSKRINLATIGGVNFAGHCTIIEWGCGITCRSSAIVDLISKKVYSGPSSVTGLIYRADSKMIIANPPAEDLPKYVVRETDYFVWENDSLRLIKKVEF